MPDVEDVLRDAQSLEPDDRLRLIARLWLSLPPECSPAPSAEERAEIELCILVDDPDALGDASRRIAKRILAERIASTSPAKPPPKIYSAPRRFDLATIFAVTSAYAVLLGLLSGLHVLPEASLVIAGFIAIVGVAQAALFGGHKPRLASVLTGAVSYTAISIVLWLIAWRMYSSASIVPVIVQSLVAGSLFGYIAGVLVGGVFLVADALRQRFNRQATADVAPSSKAG